MHLLRNIPIKRKLTAIIMLTCSAALLLACLVFVTYEQITFRRTMALDLSILTDMFDDNVAPGLAFNDVKSIEQVLHSLDAHPHVLAAAAYDKSGQVVGKYQRAGLKTQFSLPSARETGTHFEGNRLDAFRTVMLAGENIGTIYISSDLREIQARFWRYGVILSLVLVGASLLALWLSSKLQTIISEPIFHLAKTVALVASEKNYAIRAIKHGDDELGRFIDGFNEMLAQIQKQNNDLQEARENLEKRVEERTNELQLEIAERKQSQESLLLLSSAIEQSADSVMITRRDGVIEYANPALCRLTGYSKEEVLGQTPKLLNSAQHPPAFFDSLWKTILSGKLFNAEFINRKKNGELFTEEKTIGPVLDSNGAITHFVATGRDITERKRKEEEMELLHRKLLETSRAAGMAEVATGVLHNVGNVLNSVNVSATLVADKMRKSKAANLGKVAALLEEHAGDLGAFLTSDPRGKQLPGYLSQLTTHLTSEQQNVVTELESLRKNIEHIKDIVAMQQTYAKVSGVTETVKIADLVEDAVRMNAGALARHGVELVRQYEEVPAVAVDKHKVLQILVNLIRNAKYACDDTERSDKRLTLRVCKSSRAGVPPAAPGVSPAMANDSAMDHGRDAREGIRDDCPTQESLLISVIDNGVGIPRENLTRIFNHGFTTRKDGHGFGLHSGALAAKEMGGALQVHSDGVGQGATFTLELPLNLSEKQTTLSTETALQAA